MEENNKMSYSERVAEHYRLTILRCLQEEDDGKINESLLAEYVADFGFSGGRDHLRIHLKWLSDAGCVKVHDVRGIAVAELTEKGADHVERRALIPGIKKPSVR